MAIDFSKASQFSAYIPSDGFFRGSNDSLDLYRKSGSKIEQFDLGEIGKQELIKRDPSKDQYGNYNALKGRNYGDQVAVAVQILKEKYNFDFGALPQYNIGDLNTVAAREGLQVARRAGPEGGPDWYIHKGGDILSLVQQSPQISQGANEYKLNTPQDIATAQQQLAQAQASQPASDLLHKQQMERNLPIGASAGYTEINPSQFGISQDYVDDLGEGALLSHGGVTYVITPSGTLRPRDQAVQSGAIPFSGSPGSSAKSIEQYANEIASTVVEGAIANGKTLNPNITDEQLSLVDWTSFLTQAKSAVSPYYQSKISQLTDSFKRSLESLGVDLSEFETDTTRAAEKRRVEGEETLAGRGLAFSSGRQDFVRDVSETAQRDIEAKRRDAYNRAQTVASELEGTVGTEAVRGLGVSPIGGRSLQFGSTPVIGDIQYQQGEAEINRARALASDENLRRQEAYNRTRNLSFS